MKAFLVALRIGWAVFCLIWFAQTAAAIVSVLTPDRIDVAGVGALCLLAIYGAWRYVDRLFHSAIDRADIFG